MNFENALPVVLALIGLVPGTIALFRQRRKDASDAEAEKRDDNRDDFKALFDAATQLGDAGTALIEPLTGTIQKLRTEMQERDRIHQREINELEVRLAAAERNLAELKRINEELYNENSKLINQLEFYRRELQRLSQYEPSAIPREPRKQFDIEEAKPDAERN